MCLPHPHPDTIKDWQDFKAIKRGGRQEADTAAMNAMLEALNNGKTRAEAETIFNQTYKTYLHGFKKS